MSRWSTICGLVLVLLFPAVSSLPSVEPALSSLTTIPPLRPKPSRHNATSLRDPYPVDCIRKPRLYHLNIGLCKPITDRLLAEPHADEQKRFFESTTQLGESPCYIELKRASGGTVLELTAQELVLAVQGVLAHCDKYKGAGWAQVLPEIPWYDQVYGDPRI